MQFLRQKQKRNRQSDTSNKAVTDTDRLYAVCRRQEARIKQLEIECSTLRRDVNATRRKVYRENEADSPQITQGAPNIWDFL